MLDDRHHLTLVCRDPGCWTLRGTSLVAGKTVGVRIPRHVVAQALLAELGEPLVSSCCCLARTSP
jgi:tRNA A37 threonylcarbamoyladenosine synthetase subunit TsaC/SUA5/YrdC